MKTFQTKIQYIGTLESIRHIINAQPDFQHSSDTSEIHWCTSEIFRHNLNIWKYQTCFKCSSGIPTFWKYIWNTLMHIWNFLDMLEMYFQGITKLSELNICGTIIFRHISTHRLFHILVYLYHIPMYLYELFRCWM